MMARHFLQRRIRFVDGDIRPAQVFAHGRQERIRAWAEALQSMRRRRRP